MATKRAARKTVAKAAEPETKETTPKEHLEQALTGIEADQEKAPCRENETIATFIRKAISVIGKRDY